MRADARALVLLVLAALAGACSSGEAVPSDGGGAGTGGPGEMSCQQIRLCVAQTPCATDACVQSCAARGGAAARTAFEALQTCTTRACAIDDQTCACDEQCLADGTCLEEVDACLLGLSADDICDNICH